MKKQIISSSGVFKEFIYAFQLHQSESRQHPWEDKQRLSAAEKRTISSSVQQFQLGEGSSGERFLRRAQLFSAQSGDSSYAEAVKLFIAEEQRHSAMLGRFMEQEGIPKLKSHWVDWCFRSLRHLAGAETAATVLVTAELIARPYYRALRGATSSPLLKSICEQIIAEEEVHIEFQATSLALMQLYRPAFVRLVAQMLHSGLMRTTSIVAWHGHRSVLSAGNYTFREFEDECMRGVRDFLERVRIKVGELQERYELKEFIYSANLEAGNGNVVE